MPIFSEKIGTFRDQTSIHKQSPELSSTNRLRSGGLEDFKTQPGKCQTV